MKYLKQSFLSKVNANYALKHWRFWSGFGATFVVFFTLTLMLTVQTQKHVVATFIALLICTLLMSFMIGDTVEEDGW